MTERLPTRRERFEGFALSAFLGALAMLPMDTASWLGGALGRLVGARIGVTRRARRNLALAMPERADEHERIITEMWDNLGRVVAEYAHLTKLRLPAEQDRVEIVGLDYLQHALDRKQSCIIFSGHLANWEIGCIVAGNAGLDVVQVYRAANNPVIEAKMAKFRAALGVEPVPKGAGGARKLIAAIKQQRILAMLIDQKMNDGIPIPFFGHYAMTASAAADLTVRYEAALLPCKVERLKGARFRFTMYPALELPRSGNHHDDVRTVMTQANARLEQWIREKPGQWFWLHRRWPDS